MAWEHGCAGAQLGCHSRRRANLPVKLPRPGFGPAPQAPRSNSTSAASRRPQFVPASVSLSGRRAALP